MHLDVCGLMSVPFSSGYLYYVIFIDDFYQKTWIYFLKSKNEVFNGFKEFRDIVENHIGIHILVFRTDTRGEFTDNDFGDFCQDAGIKKELIVP